MDPLRRATRALLIVLALYAALVATHLGEFWPFSIFPMFSQTGNPWTRAMVMDVTDLEPDDLWRIDRPEDLPGQPIPLRAHGVDAIDHANFVVKTEHWEEARIQALRDMYGPSILTGRTVLVYRVTGTPDDQGAVTIVATPFLLLGEDHSAFNPLLPREAYFREP